MGHWLGNLFRKVGGQPDVDPGRDDPAWLAGELVRLYEAGRYQDAENVARRLVDRQRAVLGERHPDYATALSNLGLLLQKQGHLVGAEPLLRQAREIRREALGEKHPQYAASLSHLAELLQLRGDLAAAEPLLRVSLGVLAEAVGESHPDYATGLTSLGLLMHRRGDIEQAEPLLRQAMEVRRESLGERHPQFATALSNMALILQRRGDLAGAERLFRQALEVRTQALGEHHPDYGASLSHLAQLLMERQDPKAAEPLLVRAIEVRKASLGETHRDVQSDALLLAKLRRTLETAATPAPAAVIPQPKPATPPEPAPAPTAPSVPIPTPKAAPSTPEAPRPTPAPLATTTPPKERPIAPPPPPPATPAPTSLRAPGEIAGEIRALLATFSRVGAELSESGRRMRELGLPPDPALLNEAAVCERTFGSLREELAHRIRSLGPEPALAQAVSETPAGVPALLDRVETLARVEADRANREHLRRQTLALLDRAEALRHRDPSASALLRPVQENVRAIRQRLDANAWTAELSREATSLAGGSHALASLLRLAEADDRLPDADWGRLYRDVAGAYGPPIAAATARKRLTSSGASAASAPAARVPVVSASPNVPPGPPSRKPTTADLTDAALGDVAVARGGKHPA